MSRMAWYMLLSTDWRRSKIQVLLLNVYIRIMMLSCKHLGHSGDTVPIPNLQFKNKSERK